MCLRRVTPFVLLFIGLGCASVPADLTPSAPGPATAWQDADEDADAGSDDDGEADSDGGGFVRGVLLYIPNRVFDVLDIVRARLRVGPGLALSLRATDLADLYVGGYTSIWAGIPGPRAEPSINWPFGIEGRAGLELGPADIAAEAGDPDYGPFEFGLGVQLLIIGADIGIEPFEILDFALGLLTFDPSGDDL